MIARVVGLVEAPKIGLDLPLDVRGTAFQRRVWQALKEIPVGGQSPMPNSRKRIRILQVGACRRRCLRREQARCRNSLPSRDPH